MRRTPTISPVDWNSPPASAAPRWRDPFPWIILAVAVGVRLVLWWQWTASPMHEYYVVDHAYYLDWARRIVAGELVGTEVFEQAPGYAYLLAAGLVVLGDRLELVLAVQMCVGCATAVLLYLSVRRLTDRTTALVAGGLTATYGPLAFHEALVMKTFLVPFLTTACLYCLLRFGEFHRRRWLVVTGAAIAAACLVRENHVLLLVPAWAWLWTGQPNGTATPRQRVVWTAWLTGTVMICLLPTTIRNWAVSERGAFVPVTAGGGEVLYMGHGPFADGYHRAPDFVDPHPLREHEDFRREASRRAGRKLTRSESSRYWHAEARRAVRQDSVRELWLVGRKLRILGHDFEVDDSENFTASRRIVPVLAWLPTWGVLFGLGVVGIVFGLNDWRRHQLVWGLLAVHGMTVVLTYNFARFRLGMTPIWCACAAAGATTIFMAFRERRFRTVVVALAMAVLLTAWSFTPPPGHTDFLFPVDDEMFSARMALRAGDLEGAAASFDRALEELADRIDDSEPHANDPVALRAWEIGEMLRRDGELEIAHRFYARAVARPNAPANRAALLQHWLSVLLTAESAADGLPVPSPELNSALEQLQSLEPGRVDYWALATPFAATDADVTHLSQGLETAWASADKDSLDAAVWYWTGKAVLAETREGAASAGDAARRALALLPNHPWRVRLQRIASESPAAPDN